jgi:CheY-like chemotaxis protein
MQNQFEHASAKPKILIADDESAVRGLIRDSLKFDYEVFEAENGSTAMQMMESVPMDLIITDVCMPEKDGLETIQALRRVQRRIKILAVSGAFDGFFLNAARVLGADAILEKPFHPHELLKCVQMLLPAG